MKTLQEFYQDYCKAWKEYDEKREFFNKDEYKEHLRLYSHTAFIRKLVFELEKLSGMKGDYSGPCGICCSYYVKLTDEHNKYIIEITIGRDVTDFCYRTGRERHDGIYFAPGTLGAINGMNYEEVPLPIDTEKILQIMKGNKQ